MYNVTNMYYFSQQNFIMEHCNAHLICPSLMALHPWVTELNLQINVHLLERSILEMYFPRDEKLFFFFFKCWSSKGEHLFWPPSMVYISVQCFTSYKFQSGPLRAAFLIRQTAREPSIYHKQLSAFYNKLATRIFLL